MTCSSDDLPADLQASVDRAIPARDRADAQTKVDRLRSVAGLCRSLVVAGTRVRADDAGHAPADHTGHHTGDSPADHTASCPADHDGTGRGEQAQAQRHTLSRSVRADNATGRRERRDRYARGGGMGMTTTVEPLAARTRRGAELLLLIVAIAIVLGAWISVDLNRNGTVPANIVPVAGGLVVLAVVVHLVLRWKAPYADPVLLPITTALNGLGLVMIHRLDLARGHLGTDGSAYQQIVWTTFAVSLTVAVIWLLRDHRLLRRYTFVSMAVGFVLLLLPLLPGIGREVNGSRIWIGIGPLSFQPGEFAKIALAVFFAGYLVQTRDVLCLAGRRILGFTFPRGRDLGPIIVAWVLALLILVFEKDLGSALLFFGLFVAMLYVATERVSWIAIGLLLFAAAVAFALASFAHFQRRVDLWLDPFSPDNLERSNQLANGLWGMAAGGLTGTGLGAGRPWLTSVRRERLHLPQPRRGARPLRARSRSSCSTCSSSSAASAPPSASATASASCSPSA